MSERETKITRGQFRRKSETVAAVYFDGTNKDEILTFFGGTHHEPAGDGTTVWRDRDNGRSFLAYPQMWVVLRNGEFSLEGSDFERDYEAQP